MVPLTKALIFPLLPSTLPCTKANPNKSTDFWSVREDLPCLEGEKGLHYLKSGRTPSI